MNFFVTNFSLILFHSFACFLPISSPDTSHLLHGEKFLSADKSFFLANWNF